MLNVAEATDPETVTYLSAVIVGAGSENVAVTTEAETAISFAKAVYAGIENVAVTGCGGE